MERADEVLPLGKVDAHLATDRGIDLTHERRRNGYPLDPAHVARRHEAHEIGRRAASHGNERGRPLERERTPEAFDFGDGFRRLAGRDELRGVDLMELDDASVGHDRVSIRLSVRSKTDASRREDDAVEIVRARVGNAVLREALVVQRTESVRVPCERPPAVSDALPRLLRRHLEMHTEGVRLEGRACARRPERPSTKLDDGRGAPRERLDRNLLLQRAERRFSTRLEDLGDRLSDAGLDESVDRDELPPETRGHERPECRLARPHEANEGEVAP